MSISVLIVDDHGMFREGLYVLLESEEDIEVVGQASDGMEALELVGKVKPDIVLMDAAMPILGGAEATQAILAKYPSVRILGLSAHCEKEYITGMLKAGARGYILKDSVIDELVKAIRVVNSGKEYLCPTAAGVILDEFTSSSAPATNLAIYSQLTRKELELVKLLAENYSIKEAANILGISVKTIDARRRCIMEKLGISGIADLTKYATF